jgi:hypothetical protein
MAADAAPAVLKVGDTVAFGGGGGGASALLTASRATANLSGNSQTDSR